MRRCAGLFGKFDKIAQERGRVAGQFASLDGWQRGESPSFDAYVAEKRQEKAFDAFDQRVERAYQRMLKLHKAEVWNSYKRKLRDSGEKLKTSTMSAVNQSLSEREEWLRDVFTQIDADYRCDDAQRQEQAATEISQALRGEPNDFMKWVYEHRHERRFLGEKGKQEMDRDDASDSLPPMIDEEIDRYAALRMKMSDIEGAVKDKYGVAGVDHWDALQFAKDQDYSRKLQAASDKYQELIKQQNTYDEAIEQKDTRLKLGRILASQQRFKASMEMEEERERLYEAHQTMKKERFEVAKERRREQLRLAAELRSQGKQPEEVAEILKLNNMDELVSQHNTNVMREQEKVLRKKHTFLDMIDKMRSNIEEREGRELMGQSDADASVTHENTRTVEDPSMRSSAELLKDAQTVANTRGDTSLTAKKKALWEVLNEDKWKDPFLTVHQARLDARKTFDPTYGMMDPTIMAQKKHEWHRGHGEFAAGSGAERHILKDPGEVMTPYQWGMKSGEIHALSNDGQTKFMRDWKSGHFHVQDPKTMDIDLRFERKDGGGPIWNGPRFYKMGVEAADTTPVKPS